MNLMERNNWQKIKTEPRFPKHEHLFINEKWNERWEESQTWRINLRADFNLREFLFIILECHSSILRLSMKLIFNDDFAFLEFKLLLTVAAYFLEINNRFVVYCFIRLSIDSTVPNWFSSIRLYSALHQNKIDEDEEEHKKKPSWTFIGEWLGGRSRSEIFN